MNSFETTGTVDENILKELKTFLMNKKEKTLILSARFIAMILGFFFLYLRKYGIAIIFFSGAMIFILEYYILLNKILKVNLKKMEESNGSTSIKYTTSLGKTYVNLFNHNSGTQIQIAYGNFIKMTETKHVIALFTESNQFIVIFKEDLFDSQIQGCMDFLKSKCKNLV